MVNIRKAAMIGCGFVGSSSAFALMQSGIFSEMVMIDVNREKAEGEAMDIAHGLPFARPIRLYAGTYDDIVDAAIIIITAGANQKPDETRLDLIHKNVEIYKTIIPEIAKRNCEGMLLIVSNPVDILTYTALKLSGFPENRVLGSGTVLDTARLKYLIGEHLKVDILTVHAVVADERIGLGDDLAVVAGVGQGFLKADHTGCKDDLTDGGTGAAYADAAEHPAIGQYQICLHSW